MWQTRPCPSSSDLKRLIDGTLPASEQKAIGRHIWFCGTCQEHLESLAYDQDGSPRSISCPDHAVLKRHLDGKVSAHAAEAIEHHMESCSKCQAIVEAIDSGEELGPAPSTCPDRAVLARLLDGSLGERERKAIEHHIDSCSTCQSELDALACGDAAWPREVRNLGRGHDAESPGLKRVIGVLKDQINPEEAVTGGMPMAPEEILAFLDPPESADHLGKLGPYRVVQVLGHGGMGIVLKAFDPALHRSVAIKVLAPQLATTSSARQRFAREARAAAAIRNEHVVAIHSVDEWKGLPYLVMEFIPGVSLQERIDRTAPLDLNSILRIGMQAASGLAAAHAQGLVHRDIKPSNILLENCVERVKITDFGLARAVDDASLTQSGVVAGTPLFMAPEQARSEVIDHRADLFSLGAVLYAMCTGRSPFRAPTTLAVLRRVCDETPRPVREVNRDVPDWLAAIIDRLLAKEPASRYQDASAVAELLGRHLARRQKSPAWDGEPTKPFAPAAVEDVGPLKRSGHLRRMLQLACYLVVILAGLFVVAEVTGATRILDCLARLLHSRAGGAYLLVHVTDPSVQFSINGEAPIHGVGYFDFSFPRAWLPQKIGIVVESFKGSRKVSSMRFHVDPGQGIELEIGRDGQITVEYQGPIRSPKPRRDYFYPPNFPGHPTDPVLRGDYPIRSQYPPINTNREGTANETPLPLGSLPLQGKLPACAGLRILEYSPDGRYLIVAGKASSSTVSEMMFYDRHGLCNAKLLWMGAAPRSLVFTPDSKRFITGAEDGKIQVWDVSSFASQSATLSSRFPDPLATLDDGHQAVSSLALSPDGTLLASGSVKGELTVRQWKPAEKGAQQFKDISPPQAVIEARWGAAISSLSFSPDGAMLVVTLDTSTPSVDLWDIIPGDPAQIHQRGFFKGAPSNVQSSCFSSDGRFLAIGGMRSVVIWDRQRIWSALPSLRGAEANQVTRVACSKGDRRLLAVGYGDGTVSIWENMCELARIHAHDKRIAGLVFTPDGKNLATGAEDGGPVRLWDLSSALKLGRKGPQHEADTFPSELGGQPIEANAGLTGDARWNEAVANEASARASREKAIASRDVARGKFETMKALGEQRAVEVKLVEESGLRITVAENGVVIANAEVVLADAKKKQVEIDFARERVQKAIDWIKPRQPNDPALVAYEQQARDLSQRELELTRDAAAAVLERAKAKLAQATANVAFRTKQFNRLQQLHEQRAVELRIVQEIKNQLRAAETDQRAVQATVSVAQSRLKAAEESVKARKDQ